MRFSQSEKSKEIVGDREVERNRKREYVNEAGGGGGGRRKDKVGEGGEEAIRRWVTRK